MIAQSHNLLIRTIYIIYAISTFILTVYGIRSSCNFQMKACITANRNYMHAHRELKVPEIRSHDYLSEQITFSPPQYNY